MSDSRSLIATQAEALSAAPFLFLPEEMDSEYIGPVAQQGHYTAERLFAERPEIYREVVRLSAEDVSIRQIKRLCKVHHRTIEAVRRREGETIDTLKREIGGRCFSVGRMLIESIEEDVMAGRLKPEHKAVTFGIIAEKGQLLTGGATSRVERLEVPERDEFAAYLDNLPVAEVTEMGLPADSVGQMAGAPARPAGGLADRGAEGVSGSDTDKTSDVLDGSSLVDEPDMTGSVTDSAGNLDAGTPGGRGSAK